MRTTNTPHLVHLGDTFGRLHVLGFSHHDKRRRRHYLCRCECGKEKTVQGTLLRSGNTQSCGCLVQDAAHARALQHGLAARNQVIAGYRHKAKKAEIVFALTISQFERIAQSPCFYCGALPANIKRSSHGTGDYVYNGIDRIDSHKGYVVNNTIPCCRRCNLSKSNQSQGEFIAWIARAYQHLAKTAMATQWGV